MATLSLVVTPQPTNVPPRVKIDVTDSGTPAITSVTLTRTDNSGVVEVVRTSDGNPLTLVTSGAVRVGTIYDYEMALGTPVVYSTVAQPTVTATTTVNETRSWLVHPNVPARSILVDFKAGSFSDMSYPATTGIFTPKGRRNAVVITDGQRKGARGTFTLSTATLADLEGVKSIIDDASPLLLNVPDTSGLDIGREYIAVLDVTVKRPSDVGTEALREIEMPFVVVDSPVGGSQSQFTWTDVIAKYSTWTALITANPTWADVLDPTT